MSRKDEQMQCSVLRAARIMDKNGSVRTVDIWIEGTRISEISEPGSREMDQASALEMACDGLFCLPGLIDMHTHITAPGDADIQKFQDFFRVLNQHGQGALRAGVTTVRDLGGMPEFLLNLRQKSADNTGFPGVVVAGPLFTAPGGHPTIHVYQGIAVIHQAATRQFDDPQQARGEVHKLAAAGVDLIKVVSTGCLAIPEQNNRVPKMRREVLAAIVEAAHEHGLKVVTHTATAQDVRECVQAGCDGIEHGIVVDGPAAYDDDLVELLLQRRVCYTPTLVVFEARAPRLLQQAQMNAKRMADAGVIIGAGSDAGNPGVPFGAGLLRELELLREAGIPAAQVIAAATTIAAQQLGQQDRLGAVLPGYQADLVLLEGNPLEDFSALRHARHTLRLGHLARSALS
jgi:imidazolonepropionase-like amidohydrolase